jgi:hypothetical protein
MYIRYTLDRDPPLFHFIKKENTFYIQLTFVHFIIKRLLHKSHQKREHFLYKTHICSVSSFPSKRGQPVCISARMHLK